MEYKTIYQCVFDFGGESMKTTGSEIVDFQNGFWLDDHWKFTKKANCRYWVPPSRILYIVKKNER